MTYEERVRQRAEELVSSISPYLAQLAAKGTKRQSFYKKVNDMLPAASLSVQREAEAFDIGYKTANEEPIFGPSTAESTKQSLGLVPENNEG